MMLMPCGPNAVPTGGAGVARPACSSSLSTVRIFFFDTTSPRTPRSDAYPRHRRPEPRRGWRAEERIGQMRDAAAPGPSTQASAPKAPGRLGRADARNFGGGTLMDLFHLEQVQLDRRLTAEHVDQHLELALLRVDLVDLAVEVGERPVDHAYGLADLELDPDLRGLLLHLLLDGPNLFLLKRDRAVGGADEARDARGVANHKPRVVRHHHADQDVPREDALLDVAALAVLDLDLVFHRDEDPEDLVLHVHGLDSLLEGLLDLLLVSGVSVDPVPLRVLLWRGRRCR